MVNFLTHFIPHLSDKTAVHFAFNDNYSNMFDEVKTVMKGPRPSVYMIQLKSGSWK